MKLLIVDNNRIIQYLYKLELEEEGYEVIEATTGKEALEKFVAEKPDIVTLEIRMPDIDGNAIIRLMKRKNPYIPIIISTAYDYTEAFAEVASDAFIVKSSDLRGLKENIKNFVGRSEEVGTTHTI
ncbi:MAG: response regulator [Planctomycetota bacterium]|jgi:DNA-binding response OmpR family regulator